MKLGKHFVLIHCPCFIKLGVVQLCIFAPLCKLLHRKGSVSNMHVDFRGEISEKKCVLYYYTLVNTGTKIKNKVVYLFFPSFKQHTDYQL